MRERSPFLSMSFAKSSTVETLFFLLSMLSMIVVSLGIPGHAHAESLAMSDGIESLSRQMSSEMSAARMYNIGVVDFTDLNGSVSELGVFISEELTTKLHDTQKFKLAERRLLYKVIEEQKLGLSGILDEATVKAVGKILGVDGICTGTITDLGETFKVNARAISVETGQITAAASVEINKSDAIRILMRKYTQARMDSERAKARTGRYSKMNLLVNGSFTNGFTGWKKAIGDINQGSSKTEIINWKYSPSGKMLHISHTGNGSIQLSQIVPVPSADLVLSVTFESRTHEGFIKAFSGTGVVQLAMQYFDHKGNKLGQTVILNYVKNPFADSPLIGVPRRQSDSYAVHFIEVSPNKLYQDYRLDIRQEIENNLLGIDLDAVEEIAVILWAGATDPNAGADLWVADVSLSYK